eukprot:3315572-Prymnesium_polylepis.2
MTIVLGRVGGRQVTLADIVDENTIGICVVIGVAGRVDLVVVAQHCGHQRPKGGGGHGERLARVALTPKGAARPLKGHAGTFEAGGRKCRAARAGQ